jgi:hypothetical protein
LISSLQKDFNLTTEGDVGAFLGIDIVRNKDLLRIISNRTYSKDHFLLCPRD